MERKPIATIVPIFYRSKGEYSHTEATWEIRWQFDEKRINTRIVCTDALPAWSTAEYDVQLLENTMNGRKCVAASSGIIGIQMFPSVRRESNWFGLSLGEKACYDLKVTITEHYGSGVLMPAAAEEHNFATPTKRSDVALIVDQVRFHVNKAFLSFHSAFFDKLFFGDFAEKNKDEVELKDLDTTKFLAFLQAIHPDRLPITWQNVDGLLEMANRFECQGLLRECMRFMCEDRDERKIFEKLLLAERHNLVEMVDRIVAGLTGAAILTACRFGRGRYSGALMTRLADRLGSLE